MGSNGGVNLASGTHPPAAWSFICRVLSPALILTAQIQQLVPAQEDYTHGAPSPSCSGRLRAWEAVDLFSSYTTWSENKALHQAIFSQCGIRKRRDDIPVSNQWQLVRETEAILFWVWRSGDLIRSRNKRFPGGGSPRN